MGEFRMPSLGADMEFGTVVEWLVAEGDEVSRGDIVAVVDTDKADIDVEIFESGVIEEILVPEGERVDVGVALARIRPVGDTSAPAPAPAPDPDPATEPPPATEPAPALAPAPAPEPAPDPAPSDHVAVAPVAELSPVLRRLATHLGVDVANLDGSGPNGSITRTDIETAAGAPPPSTDAVADRASAMRSAIGDLMSRSKREIPHYYVGTDIDVSAALAHLDAYNTTRPITERLLPAAILLKAAAVAARRVPELNGTWVDGRFHPADHVHLGVAVKLRGGGLVAPALHDADQLGVDELMRRLQDLVQRARSGRLRSSEMSDPTFTVTQLGDQGVDTVIGVIYPPQVALLGLGSITERPWAADGMIGARPLVRATLAADHRATDGMTGARYLTTFDQLLHEPETL